MSRTTANIILACRSLRHWQLHMLLSPFVSFVSGVVARVCAPFFAVATAAITDGLMLTGASACVEGWVLGPTLCMVLMFVTVIIVFFEVLYGTSQGFYGLELIVIDAERDGSQPVGGVGHGVHIVRISGIELPHGFLRVASPFAIGY